MKALVFEKNGLENLRFQDIEDPKVGDHDVLIRVRIGGINPIDYFVVNYLRVTPIPHIPGAEFAGIVEKVGSHVRDLKVGDKVVIYPRVHDGKCDLCLSGYEMICRNGGIVSVITNGGFSEYAVFPERNVFKIPDEITWDIAGSLTVSALTSYHALKEANVRAGEYVVVFGASGNTGMFVVQLAKLFGAKVIAISRKQWLKEFGADVVIGYHEVNKVKEITEGKGADVVINSLGSEFFDKSLEVVGSKGRIVTFGTLTGQEVKINLSTVYSKHISLIGVTGGSKRELLELINMANKLKVKIWKRYNLSEGSTAISSVFDKNRDGRIMLEI
jgi:NADPH:quinone reductase-like Zn-dependent oxidoreductase